MQKRLDSKTPRKKSLRVIVEDFKINTQAIKRILNEDLGKKCYRRVRVLKLKNDQKINRENYVAYE